MSWSSQFVADLEAQVLTPRFRLERQVFGTEAGDTFAVYSDSGVSPQIARVRCEGHELDPATLGSIWGKTSVELAGNDLGDLHLQLARGTFVVLYAGFPGYAESDFQPIAVGMVRNVKGYAPRWVIEIIDLPSGLRQRPTLNAYDALLFDDVDSTTTLNAGYGITDTTVTVLSTTGFARETGGNGAIRITSSTAGTLPFYLVYSATTATTFTVSALDQMATRRSTSHATDLVEEVAFLSGHPLDIARKILASTGAATNGTYDTYPSDWGLYVPNGLIDHDDVDNYKNNVVKVSSGSYTWEWPQVGAVDDGIGWLASWLGEAGLFMTMRQGRVTVRGLQAASTPIGARSVAEIVDADIVAIVAHEWFASSATTEYAQTRVFAYSTGLTSSLSTGTTNVYQRPAGEIRDWDVSDRVFSNDAAVRAEMLNRVYEVGERTPELLVLVTAGLRFAGLAPGDIVTVTCARVHSRIDGRGGFDRRACFVVKVSSDWTSPAVQVGLLAYPTAGDLWA